MATAATLLLSLAACTLLSLAVGAPVIQPRPVNNSKDPRDGEPFEWEPVDDDPWPGPSFTFPDLPGLDDLGERGPSPVQMQIAMQFMRALFSGAFNNNIAHGRNKPTSSNEILDRPSLQKLNKRYMRNWSPNTQTR